MRFKQFFSLRLFVIESPLCVVQALYDYKQMHKVRWGSSAVLTAIHLGEGYSKTKPGVLLPADSILDSVALCRHSNLREGQLKTRSKPIKSGINRLNLEKTINLTTVQEW